MADLKRRRDRHEIAAEILESAKFGILRTRLMFKANISYGQFTEYVPMLLEKGLLESSTLVQRRQPPKHVLKTTEKGEKFLESLKLWTRFNRQNWWVEGTDNMKSRFRKLKEQSTIFTDEDSWRYETSQGHCSGCGNYDASLLRGSELMTKFPYLVVADLNVIFPYVHPNCHCHLSREW